MANSRREPSLRADARARYGEAAAALDPSPSVHSVPPYRAPTKLAQSDDPTLTERVRALYEGGVVPVREIAALAGVTERTLYKYVRAYGWTPRVTRRSGDGRLTAAQRAARGAGGRFIPLADAAKPHAHGLKALDPDGAQRAAQRCARAAALSEEAAAATLAEARMRTFELLAGALVELHRLCAPQPDARGGARGRAGWVPGKGRGEWLLPHERAADEARAQAQARRSGNAAANPRVLRLALRLQAAILREMEHGWSRP
jgi:hypothetical protein